MAQSISTLLILGASGDLASRLLIPALGQLLIRHPNRPLRLIGAASDDWSAEKWRSVVASAFASENATGQAVDAVLASTSYHSVDVTDPRALAALLSECEGVPAIYFALPPAVTVRVCDALAEVTLPTGTELALEKPFGVDEASAIALNAQLLRLVREEQIHRVDHFLGRSTVLNLVGLRFANRVFEPLWSNQHIARIDIIYDEQLGLEGRAGYYDQAGALVDMIQSHLMQVMAVVAMEPPSTLSAADIRDAKELVLRATRVRAGSPKRSSRRARYTAGSIDGTPLTGYLDEPGVSPDRGTETLAEVTLEIDTWRWAGVPFTLRSGKALGQERREIVVTFKPVPHLPVGLRGRDDPSVLRIYLSPDEMSLELNINGSDDPEILERTNLTATFGSEGRLAYEEVIEGLLDGDPALSVRGDTAVECWRIVAPVVDAWRTNAVPLEEYPAGTAGPADWAPLG